MIVFFSYNFNATIIGLSLILHLSCWWRRTFVHFYFNAVHINTFLHKKKFELLKFCMIFKTLSSECFSLNLTLWKQCEYMNAHPCLLRALRLVITLPRILYFYTYIVFSPISGHRWCKTFFALIRGVRFLEI